MHAIFIRASFKGYLRVKTILTKPSFESIFQEAEKGSAASSAKVEGELNRLGRGGVAQNFDPRNIQVVSLDNPRAFMHMGFSQSVDLIWQR